MFTEKAVDTLARYYYRCSEDIDVPVTQTSADKVSDTESPSPQQAPDKRLRRKAVLHIPCENQWTMGVHPRGIDFLGTGTRPTSPPDLDSGIGVISDNHVGTHSCYTQETELVGV